MCPKAFEEPEFSSLDKIKPPTGYTIVFFYSNSSLCDNVFQLFELATSESSSTIESMAFEILTLENEKIDRKLHDDNVMTEALQKAAGNEWALNKFLSIFEFILGHSTCDKLTPVTHCLLQLFNSIDTFSVFSFFKTICSEPQYASIQRSLIANNFDRLVIDELRCEVCSKNRNPVKLRNIADVVTSWDSSEVMRTSLKDYRLCEVLNMDWGDDESILDAVWGTINVIYN